MWLSLRRPRSTSIRRVWRWTALLIGPAAGAAAYLMLPETIQSVDAALPVDHRARVTMGLALWMAIWWMTEPIPISATALLPLAVLPLLSVSPIADAARPYAHPLIFLFMGGFLMALAMERWNLHKRVAFQCIRAVGTRPAGVVAGFMGLTAVLSMGVSNTATALLMLPIALSVVDLYESSRDSRPRVRAGHFPVCLLLGVAYAASIGGVATLIGTPPNIFLASFMSESAGAEVTFVNWLAIGLPLTAVFLPVTWFLLTRVLFPLDRQPIADLDALAVQHAKRMGPFTREERSVAIVFVAAAVLWIFRPAIVAIEWGGLRPFDGLTDPGIAVMAAMLLFILPAERDAALMNWESAAKLPWGILILFGGGLSLAGAIKSAGVGEMLAAWATTLGDVPAPVIVAAVTTLVIFLTELTSNTATAAAFIPILAGFAPGLGLHPLMLAVPAAVASSLAFMLPVATPPNAVIFGSGYVSIRHMVRAGFVLNLVGMILVTLATLALVPLAFPAAP